MENKYPVARPQDLFEDPQLNQSGSLAATPLPGGGLVKLPKILLRMNHSPCGKASSRCLATNGRP